MAITSYQQQRFGTLTIVTVTSDLSGTIYYHWYIDGAFIASTQSPMRSFTLETGDQIRIEVKDTNDADYDPIANAPDGYPARRTIWWIRSTDDDVVSYRVEQKKGAGDWTSIGIVQRNGEAWTYSLLSPRLDDLNAYQWRVIPVDVAGNDGTARTVDAEDVVRTSDAPDFTISFDSGTAKVTFAAAA
jgi:hypothetical protein